MEKVIEVYYPKTKERRITTLRQDQAVKHPLTAENKINTDELIGERARLTRWASKLIAETIREASRV